jgi:hypothetical protein
MMFSDWIETWRAKRHTTAIARHKKRIKNRFGFGEDRHRAMEFFKDLGGREGALGLLERFMINTEASIRDEEEKQDVFEILVKLGPDVIPAIEEYVNRKDAATVPITWPLKVLGTVAEPAEAVAVIIRALTRMGTSYTREPERKVLLVSQLAEYNDPRVVPALIPFLRDHRDEVQLETLAALTRKADETAREAMLEILVDEDTPVRLRASVAEALQRLGWDVRGYRKKVEEVLPEGMSVDRSGRIKGRSALSPSEEDSR